MECVVTWVWYNASFAFAGSAGNISYLFRAIKAACLKAPQPDVSAVNSASVRILLCASEFWESAKMKENTREKIIADMYRVGFINCSIAVNLGFSEAKKTLERSFCFYHQLRKVFAKFYSSNKKQIIIRK